MASKKSVKELAENFIRDVKDRNVALTRAILFGSYATDNASGISDIDIALVADDFKGVPFIDIDKFMKVKIKKQYAPIHVQTFNSKYFKTGDAFTEEIIRTGIEIKV